MGESKIMFLIFNEGSLVNNQASFDALNNMISISLGYPNKEGTVSYNSPIYHPDGERVAISIMPGVIQFLSNEQVNNLIEQLPKDWNRDE